MKQTEMLGYARLIIEIVECYECPFEYICESRGIDLCDEIDEFLKEHQDDDDES